MEIMRRKKEKRIWLFHEIVIKYQWEEYTFWGKKKKINQTLACKNKIFTDITILILQLLGNINKTQKW